MSSTTRPPRGRRSTSVPPSPSPARTVTTRSPSPTGPPAATRLRLRDDHSTRPEAIQGPARAARPGRGRNERRRGDGRTADPGRRLAGGPQLDHGGGSQQLSQRTESGRERPPPAG